MFDRVPVPTDNVFKFYALFTLILLIFSIWGDVTPFLVALSFRVRG